MAPGVNLMAPGAAEETDTESDGMDLAKILNEINEAGPDPTAKNSDTETPVSKRKRDGGVTIDYNDLFGMPVPSDRETASDTSAPPAKRVRIAPVAGANADGAELRDTVLLARALTAAVGDLQDKGYNMMAQGLVAGSNANVLTREALAAIDFIKTRVLRFNSSEGRLQRDTYAHCTFELNGARGVEFTFETESMATESNQPFKFLVQFVIGVRLCWEPLLADRRLVLTDAIRAAEPKLLPLLRVAAGRKLPASTLACIAGYALPSTLLPLVLYWKVHQRRWRANVTSGVVRAYPPSLQHPHRVKELLNTLVLLITGGRKTGVEVGEKNGKEKTAEADPASCIDGAYDVEVDHVLGAPSDLGCGDDDGGGGGGGKETRAATAAPPPRPTAEQFLSLLLSLTQCTFALHDGRWGEPPRHITYLPVAVAEGWGRPVA